MFNIYRCDFAKRCPVDFFLDTGISRVQAGVAEKKKNRGLTVLLGVSREPRPRPIRGWEADLFGAKTRSGRGDFVTLIRVSCQKAVQLVREFFL